MRHDRDRHEVCLVHLQVSHLDDTPSTFPRGKFFDNFRLFNPQCQGKCRSRGGHIHHGPVPRCVMEEEKFVGFCSHFRGFKPDIDGLIDIGDFSLFSH